MIRAIGILMKMNPHTQPPIHLQMRCHANPKLRYMYNRNVLSRPHTNSKRLSLKDSNEQHQNQNQYHNDNHASAIIATVIRSLNSTKLPPGHS